MEEQNNKRKKYIRNVAAVFFAALLILTFCSNTIMNLTLPQVTVTKLKSGTIYNRVRGNGKVEAVHHYEIKAETEKKIARMSVSEGDTVSKNQLLFLYEDGENQELEAEKEALAALELEYQKSILEMGNEYGTSNLVIQNARDELLAAMEKKERSANAQGEIAGLKQSIQQKTEEIKALESAAAEAQKKLEDEGAGENGDAVKEEIQMMKRELEGLYTALGDLQADLKSAMESGNGQEEIRLTREIRDKEKEITYKEQDLEKKREAYKEARKNNKTREKLEEKAAEAKRDYESMASKLEEEKERLTQLEADIMPLEEAEALVKDKEVALKNLLLDARKNNLDFQSLGEKVSRQEAEVGKLEENQGGREVRSPVSGVISRIAHNAGDTVLANETVVTINMIEEGYTVTFPVTLEQSQYVAVGNEASVLNVWDESANAKLINIKANPEDPDRSRLLTFRVWGEEIAPGQTLAVSVGEQKNEYDTIVPRNAVYEDNQGKFVYALRIRSTPLGNRYLAERKTVEVLASDDSYAAVLADLSPDDYIITESIEPLGDGMKVRLVD